VQGGSSGTSISDHWPEAIADVEEFRSEGCLAAENHGGVEASSSYHPSADKNKLRKGKGLCARARRLMIQFLHGLNGSSGD
jgi:hypothetical protein